MNWKHVVKGMTVYHSIFTHLGPGEVLGIVATDPLSRLFERGNKRVLVKWQGRETASRLQLSALRMKPNRKKIQEMVKVYQRRGVDAKDGGDRLIIPKKSGRVVDDEPEGE